MNMKRIIAMSVAVTMAAGIMSGCAKNDGNAETTSAETTVGTSAEAAAAEPIKAIFGEIRSEYNTSLDMTERPLTASGVAADFSAKYEAEDGKTEGRPLSRTPLTDFREPAMLTISRAARTS